MVEPIRNAVNTDHWSVIGLRKGAFWSLVRFIVVTSTGLPVTILLVRLLSHSSYGIYAASTATSSIISTTCSIGLGAVISRAAASAYQNNAFEDVRQVFSEGQRIATVLSLVTLLVAGATITLEGHTANKLYVLPIAILTLPVIGNPYQLVAAGIMSGIGAPRRIELAVIASSMIMLIGVIAMATTKADAIFAVSIAAMSQLAAIAINLLGATKAIREKCPIVYPLPGTSEVTQGRRDPILRHKMLLTIVPSWGTSLNYMAIAMLDVTVLSHVRTPGQVGVYAPLSSMVNTIWIIGSLPATYLLPAAVVGGLDRGAVSRDQLFSTVTRLGLILAGAPLCLLITNPAGLLSTVFGPGFGPDYAPAYILAAGLLVHVITGPNSDFLFASEHLRSIVYRTVVVLMISIGLCFWLIPTYGLVGAAISTTIPLVVMNLWNTVALIVYEHLHPFGHGGGAVAAVLSVALIGIVVCTTSFGIRWNMVSTIMATVLSMVVVVTIYWLTRSDPEFALLVPEKLRSRATQWRGLTPQSVELTMEEPG